MVWKKACRIHSECHRSMPPCLTSPLFILLLPDPPFISCGSSSSPLGHPLLTHSCPGLAELGMWYCWRKACLAPFRSPLDGQLTLPRSSPSSLPLFHPFLVMLIFLFQGPPWGQVVLTPAPCFQRTEVAHRGIFLRPWLAQR